MQSKAAQVFFKAYRSDGSQESGFIDAENEVVAARLLSQKGLTPYEIRSTGATQAAAGRKPPKATKGSSVLGAFQPRLDPVRLFGDLAIMLNAGFNIDIALRATADAEPRRAQRARINEILSRITEGKSIADAFASQPELSDDVTALIASGEDSGKIGVVIDDLAKTYALRDSRRSEVVEALLYPAFLVLIMIGAFMLLSLYLVPAIKPIFDDAGVQPPIIVGTLSAFGIFISDFGMVLVAGLILLALALAVLARSGEFRTRVGNLVSRLPLTGSFVRRITSSRFLTTMALLLGNGVPVLEAMKLASRTAFAETQRQNLLAARQRVSDGEPFWKALSAARIFTDSVIALVKLGEESNSLAPMLQRAGAITQAQTSKTISRALTFLTPALTITLGLVVGGLVVSIMTTLLSINEIALR